MHARIFTLNLCLQVHVCKLRCFLYEEPWYFSSLYWVFFSVPIEKKYGCLLGRCWSVNCVSLCRCYSDFNLCWKGSKLGLAPQHVVFGVLNITLSISFMFIFPILCLFSRGDFRAYAKSSCLSCERNGFIAMWETSPFKVSSFTGGGGNPSLICKKIYMNEWINNWEEFDFFF